MSDAMLTGDGAFGGARLLVSDTRVALLLLTEARDRAARRVFGVPREDAFIVSIIGLAALAGAAQSTAKKIVAGPNPSLGDTVVGTAVFRAAVRGVAGDWSEGTPLLGTLVAISVVGAGLGPTFRASIRGLKAVSHRVRTDFDHRYGHLIRPNHPDSFNR